MGIFMLTSHMDDNASVSMEVSLSDIAREQAGGKLVMLVDGSALVHRASEQVAERGLNGWEWTIGGEHSALHVELATWVHKLRMGSVEPVVCFDPPKGVETGRGQRRKADEMKRRSQQRCESVGRALLMLQGGRQVLWDWESTEGKRALWQLPAMSSWQARTSLMSMGVECLTFEVEADDEIIKECARRGAYAVLGSDSDFYAMHVSIPINFLWSAGVNFNLCPSSPPDSRSNQGLQSCSRLIYDSNLDTFDFSNFPFNLKESFAPYHPNPVVMSLHRPLQCLVRSLHSSTRDLLILHHSDHSAKRDLFRKCFASLSYMWYHEMVPYSVTYDLCIRYFILRILPDSVMRYDV